MVYVGIDPGKSGGIAVLDDDGRLQAVANMPATAGELANLMRRHTVIGRTWVALEYVASSPQQGVTSAFTFGKGVGRIEGVLETLGLPYSTITPATWQRRMNCLSGGDKNITKRAAQLLFPKFTITHAWADALLIAAYGRLVARRLQSARKP